MLRQSKNICGLVIAKENSNRFKGKNYHVYNGKPLFRHNVDLLNEMFDTYLCTNSVNIKADCFTIYRGVNVSDDNQPIFDLIKFAYQSMPIKYDYIVCILANTINVEKKDIERALEICIFNKLKEVRSYDINGVENGLLVLEKSVIEKYQISTYVGAITTNAKEIHYERDLLHS